MYVLNCETVNLVQLNLCRVSCKRRRSVVRFLLVPCSNLCQLTFLCRALARKNSILLTDRLMKMSCVISARNIGHMIVVDRACSQGGWTFL